MKKTINSDATIVPLVSRKISKMVPYGWLLARLDNNNNRPVPHVAEVNLLRYMPVAQAGYHSEAFATNTRDLWMFFRLIWMEL